MRFWTSDWHLNSEIVRQTVNRPWKTADEMNRDLLRRFSSQLMSAHSKNANGIFVVHIGDLIQSGIDRGTKMAENELSFRDVDAALGECGAHLFCVEGNHDASNGVPVICRNMLVKLGKLKVTVGHYPTWYSEAYGTFRSGRHCDGSYHPTIHVCGHVHNAWRIRYDQINCVINVNVGIDAYQYRLLTDSDLVELVNRAYEWWKYVDTHAVDFKTYPFEKWESDCARQKREAAADKKEKMMEWLKANKPDIYAMKVMKKK